MKNKKYILSSLLLMLSWGCSDFLEEQSQSEIRPSTVNDMEKLLEGEAYFTETEGTVFNYATDIFTDNISSNKLNKPSGLPRKLKERFRYAWESNMFNEGGGGEDLSFWKAPYDRIKGCNVILDYIDEMDGDENKRDYLKGEAYVLRGFYYFQLVNFFGLPYSYGDPKENAGVPLKLYSGVTDDKLTRASVADCYKQIEEDLLKGAELMKANQQCQSALITRLNHLAAYGLLSRVYLYIEDWDKVLSFADSVLVYKSDLLDLKSPILTNIGVYWSKTPNEILWAGTDTGFREDFGVGKPPFTASPDFLNIYGEDVDAGVKDVRADYNLSAGFGTSSKVYLKSFNEYIFDGYELVGVDTWISYSTKGDAVAGSSTASHNGGIRVAEVYLNKAEAYIHKYLESGDPNYGENALDLLNKLREHRFEEGYVYKQMEDFVSGEELLAFCLRERRRELCGEGNHRWFDLRRTGMPEIKHVYIDEDGGQPVEYVLQKEDPRYVLPIPAKVIERNPSLR